MKKHTRNLGLQWLVVNGTQVQTTIISDNGEQGIALLETLKDGDYVIIPVVFAAEYKNASMSDMQMVSIWVPEATQ